MVEDRSVSAGMKKGVHIIFRDAAWHARVRVLLLGSQLETVLPSENLKPRCFLKLVDERTLILDGICMHAVNNQQDHNFMSFWVN